MSYETELEEKTFKGNVVILFKGKYFTKHRPDSGLPAAPVLPGAGDIAYYNFEDSSEDEGGAHDLVEVGAIEYSSDFFTDGKRCVKPSAYGYFTAPASLDAALGGLANLKVAFGLKLNSNTTTSYVYFSNSFASIRIDSTGGAGSVHFSFNKTSGICSASYFGILSVNTKYFLECIVTAAGPKLYVNGVLQTPTSSQVGGAGALNAVTSVQNIFSQAGAGVQGYCDSLLFSTNTTSQYSSFSDSLDQSAYDKTIVNLKINPVLVDSRNAKTTIRNYDFSILDKDNILTEMFKNNENVFMGETVRIFLGRITGSFDFSDYYELPKTIVTDLKFRKESFSFQTQEAVALMRYPIFNETAELAFDMIDEVGLSVIVQNDISGFGASGIIKIDDEFMTYSSKDDALKTFYLSARGALGSTPDLHSAGETVYKVVRMTGNPLTIFLQMMITGSYEGNPYDCLVEGMGIDPDLIDIAEIEALRDDSFDGVEFDFYLYGIENFLAWAEEELFLACNVRLVVSADSKLTLSLLDDISFQESTKTFDKQSIIPNSVQFSVSDKKLINRISIAYDYDEATRVFQKTYSNINEASVAIYGERKTYSLEFKGIKSALDGDDFVERLVRRLLSRHSTATPKIDFQTHLDKSLALPGEVVRLNYNLPSFLGDRDFQSDLEIMQAGIDDDKAIANFSLEFTAYTGLRNGYISPSDLIASVISQKKITVPSGRGAQYRVGWIMRLATDAAGQTADAVNTITEIVGDTITFQNNFTTVLTTAHRVRFANYDEVVSDQQRYGFLSLGAANFDDGKSPYLVAF